MKKCNIANFKVTKNVIIIEFSYQDYDIPNNTVFYLEKEGKQICLGRLVKNDKKENDNTINAKITFELELKEYNEVKIKMQCNGKIIDMQILNNKNEEILEEDNHYKIFTKKICYRNRKKHINNK